MNIPTSINNFSIYFVENVTALVQSPMGLEPLYFLLSLQIISLLCFLYFTYQRRSKDILEKDNQVQNNKIDKADIENQYLDSFRSSTNDSKELAQTTVRSPKYRNERAIYPEAEFSDNEGLFE